MKLIRGRSETLPFSSLVPAQRTNSENAVDGPVDVDRAVLTELASLLGDSTSVQELLDMYSQQLPERMEALDAAFASGEFDRIARAAHVLRSASVILGLTAMARAAGSIELNALNRTPISDRQRQILDDAAERLTDLIDAGQL